MLYDSNLLIYLVSGRYPELDAFLLQHPLRVSTVTRIEVLGYHALTAADHAIGIELFALAHEYAVDALVVDRAITLRQERKLSLGDSIVAATALVHSLPLATRNVKDFSWISALEVVDPIA